MRTLTLGIHIRLAVRALLACIGLLASSASPAMNVSSGRIYDEQGNRITIQGVNWFGAETDTRVVHGLWARGMTNMLDQMKSLGFNAVRIPFCPATLQGVPTNSIDYSKNAALQGLNSLQVLDVLAGELQKRRMYFLMDWCKTDTSKGTAVKAKEKTYYDFFSRKELAMPAGNYVDLTQLITEGGQFERIRAQSGWEDNSKKLDWWHFQYCIEKQATIQDEIELIGISEAQLKQAGWVFKDMDHAPG